MNPQPEPVTTTAKVTTIDPAKTGPKLRAFRISHGVNAVAVAKKMKTSPSYISLIESGVRAISEATFDRYVQAVEAIVKERAERFSK